VLVLASVAVDCANEHVIPHAPCNTTATMKHGKTPRLSRCTAEKTLEFITPPNHP
jgi:hypothetical protein